MGATLQPSDLVTPLLLLTVGLMLVGIITWLMARDPSAVQQALNDMLRR